MAKYVAFFDLDDTVFSINSGKLMVRYAAEKGLLKKGHILWLYFFALGYKIKILSEEYLMGKIASFLKGLPEEKLIHYTEDMFDQFLKDSIREQAKAAVQKHQNYGAKVVILSASTQYICLHVKDYLKMDDYLCSDLQVINGKLSGHPLADYCYGKEKARRIHSYCHKHQLNPQDAWYYGDAPSDRAAMEEVGNAVCVSPGKKMRRLAKRNKWQIVDW